MSRPPHRAVHGILFLACCVFLAAAFYFGASVGRTVAQVSPGGTVAALNESQADELERAADELERAADAATEEAESDEAEREAAAQVAAGDEQAEEQLFYDLSQEADYMQLIGLDTIDGEESDRSVLVVDLYRGSQKFGLVQTWKIDCARSRMKIVRAMQFEPGAAGSDKLIDGEVIATTASPTSRRIAELTCIGEGQLIKSRMHRGKIIDIAAAFWGP